MNFQPLGKRILVKRLDEASATKSGIIIVESAKEKPSQGKVIAIGDKVKNITCGEKVVFGQYTGNELVLDNEKYIIIDTNDIFGIIK